MNGPRFRDISDDELEASLGRLLGAGGRLEARIVAHLAEIEERRLHLLAGYSSLYDYCRKRLALSDYEAFARIAAARAAREYPIILEMLGQRRLNLTAICEVREFLTVENHRGLLEEISGQTNLQVREVLARRFPQADVRASVKKLPELEPLSPERYGLRLTLSAAQKEKLDVARALLSHANPNGDLAVVLERALDALIARLEQRRFGQREARDSSAKQPAGNGAKETKPIEAPAATPRGAKTNEAKTNEAKTDEVVPGEAKTDEVVPGEARTDEATAMTQRGATQRGARPAEATVGEAQPIGSMLGDGKSGGAKANVPQSFETHGAGWAIRRRKHIRNVTRRELVARDGAGCSFVGGDGRCCQERGFLQFHHRQPWARGGADTPGNLQLLCRAHNRLLAERDFGTARIQKAIDRCESAGPHERKPQLGQPKRSG